MKSICLFNHKGGVSKTTTTFNLGWMLAELGKKVVMVDLDSQCNLTGLVLGYAKMSDDGIEAIYNSRSTLTLKPIIDKIINGVSVDEIVNGAEGELIKTGHENLLLLAGTLETSDLDSQMSIALKIASGVPVTKNMVGNFPEVLKKIALLHNADYLLFDLSPNVGGLNEIVLMSSDYFIVPASPDFFCFQAVASLRQNIEKWYDEIDLFKRVNKFDNPNYVIHNRPKFLGVIQQRYRPRSGVPASSFQKWIDRIKEAVRNDLVPALTEKGCAIPEGEIKMALEGSSLAPYDLANISDFNSLIAVSQAVSKPVFALTEEDITSTSTMFGKALDTSMGNSENFRIEFEALAKRVMHLTK
ncbi:AAA family ATPase [Phascolarctobacterium sp.]|uniref:ParA family protein n=1 Tax=Phascolarctobacterium sp. TaxID=2049039 RepID=UPI00307800B2